MKTALTWAALLVLMADGPMYAAEKKLISFGSADPDTFWLPDHIAEMQATPFDGTVFYARGENASGDYFSWGAWGTRAYTHSGMQYAVDQLRATNFGSFNENFLRLNVTPGNVDWFDNIFSRVTSNAGTAGWIVEQGGARGIMLDTEAYEGQLWQYSTQKYAATKSFSEYQAQVRQRGQQFMAAIQAEAPDTTIIITHSYSSVWHYLGGNASGLQNSSQALLPAFLDGMVAAAGPGIKLVDGSETLFGARSLQEFLDGQQASTSGVLPIVQDPTRYAEKFSTAFPAWINPGGFSAWHGDPSEFDQNYYTPEQFKNALRDGLNVSDQYAWVYAEGLYPWNYNGTKNIPLAYSNAMVSAKAMANSIFSDGSEYSSPGAIPGATNPTSGNWDFHWNDASAIVQARTGATVNGPSAAFSGSNYLQIGRGPNNQVAQVGAVFDSPVDVTTNSLHAEFKMFFKAAIKNSIAVGFQDAHEYAPWMNPNNYLVSLLFGDNTGVAADAVWYWDGTNHVETGLELADNAWNDVTMDWNPATGKFTLGINGALWKHSAVGFATQIRRLQFFPAWDHGMAFFDDIIVTTGGPSIAVLGDFDADGDVDGADFVVWQTHFPTANGATLAMGDADADGDVDGADFVVWQTHFPTTPGPGVATVPEPMSLIQLLTGGLVTLAGRYRSKNQP